ncbi:hypothetical protein CANINC_004245 [Pichia inconspicua]|uniref:Kinetochore protein Spc24 n=1 Tax=Pichia inconspicua TaxID=52247 RepID=A0A4T0WWM7_9ASCO|nr:hypothetical protein CANINC_004245 [[Candida] inconspicua]
MESLASAVNDTISIIDIQNDLALIDTVNNSFHEIDLIQQQNVESIQSRIEQLSRQLDNIHDSIKSFKNSSQNKLIRNELKTLELEIFNSARNLTSLNMQLNSLKLSYNENLKKLDQLESQLEELHATFLKNSDALDSLESSNIIKLKLFQSTGLKYNTEAKEIVILNKKKNIITPLKLDDNYTEYFISKFIWDNI